eukprot:TRINITY_DN15214_c0_g3_i1.p1 TRINITY_DN15214_c0_g3~~TRINITY_DN15214_c0_g3_i1.p1  ORF type:complete len:311 (-),score=62.39 TRINITY_DN15214_c0_g3_i1:163-1095(-)
MRAHNATRFEDLLQVPGEAIQWPDEYMNDLDLAPYFSGYFDDDYVVPTSSIAHRWANGQINPKQLIVGANSKDGTAAFYGSAPTLGLVPPDKPQTSTQAYATAMGAVWGAQAAPILTQYSMERFNNSAQAAYIQSDADVYVICPALQLCEWASAQKLKVWHYEFAHFQPSRVHADGFGCDNGVELDMVSPVESRSVGWASHGAETHFMFGTEIGADGLGPPNNLTHCSFTPSERVLSDTMLAYWTRFIATGDPNSAGVPEWAEYNGGSTQMLVDEATDHSTVRSVKGMHSADCKFWAQWYPWTNQSMIGS